MFRKDLVIDATLYSISLGFFSAGIIELHALAGWAGTIGAAVLGGVVLAYNINTYKGESW